MTIRKFFIINKDYLEIYGEKEVLIYIAILFTLASFIYAKAPGGSEQAPYDPSTNPNSDPAALNDAIAQGNPNIAWDKVDQTLVYPENIDKIPDQNQLTAEQLSYKAPDGKYNIDKLDASKLDPEARDEALKILGRTTEEIETETDAIESHITTYDDGFMIDYINYIRIGDVKVYKVSGFSYRNNMIEVNKAEAIEIKDGLLANVINFTGNSVEFSVGEVKKVVNKCVTISNVTNSDFKIGDRTIEISPKNNVKFNNILDCSLVETLFETYKNGTIVITKATPEGGHHVREAES